MAEQYSIQLDLAVGQLFSRLDQLERRLGGISQAAAGVQGRMDAFSAASRPMQAVATQGERVQRVFDKWAASTRNTEAGLNGLIGKLERARTNVDRNSQAYAVATQNLERYRASLRGAGNDADRFAGRVGGLQAVMGAVGAAAVVNSFKTAGVEAAGAERKLGFLTKGFGEYEAAQQAVVRVQKELGISNTEAKQGISNLYAALRPTGTALADIEKAFLGYAKAARQTGQSNAEVSGGMLQLKQALGSGTLQGDELRSIRENAPAVAQAIAKVMDTTVGGLKELGSQGKISSAIVLKALSGLADGTIPPITAMDRLNAAWTDFQAAVAGSIGPLTSGLIGFLASILEGFQKLPAPIKDVITAVGALALAVVGLAGAFVAYSFASTAIVGGLTAMGVATTATTGLFGALALAAQTAWASIAWPIVGIVAGVALLTKAAYDLSEPFAWWVDNLGPALGVMWNDLTYVAKGFGDFLTSLGSDIQSSWAGATDWFQPMADGFNSVINQMKGIWNAIPEWMKWVFLLPIQGAVKIGQVSTGYLDSVKKRVEEAKKVGDVEKKVEEDKVKAQQTSEKQLKKLADERAKMEKGLTDARKDAEDKIAELRASTAEKAKSWEQEIAKDRLSLERQIADLQSKAALDRRLSDIDGSMAGDGSIGDKVKADQKVMLQAKYDMEQKILGLNRSEDDRQAAFTEKLEKFKLETTKANGKIQQAYAEKAGQVVEGYSTASAKILMAGGQNAGAALEASATRAAQTMTNAASAAASGGSGGSGGNFKIDDIADKTLPAATRALLKTIRFAEGTAGEQGYRTMFTGKTFTDMSKHPRAIQRGGGYASDAAGAYQFLSTTWDGIGGGAMTPERQDRGAVALARRRGVDTTMPQGFTKQVADKLAPEWASFPTIATGTSYYGQGGKNYETLKRYYERELAKEQAFDRGSAQQAASPTGPNSIFKVNGPNTPSPIFQAKADPIAALANSGRQGAMQGPNMKPSIPLGQKAVLKGQAVVWNGQDWVPDTISAAAAPVGGGAAAAAAAPAGGAPANNIVPLPAGFNPASVGTVNPDQYLGGVQAAQGGLNAMAQQGKELQTVQAINQYLEQQAQLRTGITADLTTQAAQAALALQTDQQVLALIQGGITPALAEQYVQVDQIAAIERGRLEARKTELEKDLEQKDLKKELRDGLEKELQLVLDRLAAEGGVTQAIKDQIAARQALKDSPQAKIANKVAEMKAQLADTGGMITSLAGTIESELGSAMSNAISGVMEGTMTVEQAFGQMFKNIGKAFIDMATQMIAKALIMKVLGILGGGAAPGLGFGGNSDPLGAGGGFWTRAAGGPVEGGSSYLVGEQGPELFTPGSSGSITSNADMGDAMGRFRPVSGGSGADGGEAGAAGGGSGSGSVAISYNVTEINSMRFVSEKQFQEGMAVAAKRGAEGGKAMVFGDMRNKRSARGRLGI